MKKAGKVINIKGKKVYILTKNKEFVIVKKNDTIPVKGKIYYGEVFKEQKKNKPKILPTVFTILLIILTLSFVSYKFYTYPTKSFIIKMNASFRITTNRFDKIVKLEPLYEPDDKLSKSLKEMRLINMPVENSLIELFNKCIELGYIQNDFMDKYKEISIYMNNNYSSTDLTIDNFKKIVQSKNIKLSFNKSGEGYYLK